MASNKPLLDLSTLIDRERIAIDGKAYELRNPDELSLADCGRIMRNGEKIEKLSAGGDEAAEDLDAVVSETAKLVMVDVPDAVLAGLSGMQRLQVVEVFTERLLAARMRTAGGIASRMMKEGRIGAKSSPGSSTSTAGRRKSGSTKHRSV